MTTHDHTDRHVTPFTAPESIVLRERFTRLSTDDATTILRMVAPYADPDAVLELGQDRARQAYFDEIRRIARSYERIVARATIIDPDDDDAREAADTWLHETLDGHHDVIYTHAAMGVLRWSDNAAAAIDEYGSDIVNEGYGIAWSRLAYCAMEADVRDHADIATVMATIESERDELRDGIVAALQGLVDTWERDGTLDDIRSNGERDATTVDIDVRLQLHVSTSADLPGGYYLAFGIRSGDASYDLDHHGWWGAGSITWDIVPDVEDDGISKSTSYTYTIDTDLDELADSLLDEAIDAFATATDEEGDC